MIPFPSRLLASLPYGMVDLPLVLLLIPLVVASAFFSGSETALFSLSAQQRLRLTRQPGLIGRVVTHLLKDMQLLLITLMLGNMTVNVLYFVISSALLLKLDPQTHGVYLAIGSVLPLLIIIIFGEVLPKLIANLMGVALVRIVAVPLYAVHRIIGPVRIVLRSVIIAPLGRLLAPTVRPPALSSDELESLVTVSQQRGLINPTEQQVVREVVSLSRLKVRDVMTPRVDIQAIDITASPDDIHALIREHRLSKIPVYDGDIDHIVGMIYARQFLLARSAGGQIELKKLIRQVRYVPEIGRVDQLLAEMRRGHTHLAIAVDEFGGTAGLLTIKDVVEQFLGDVDVETSNADDPDQIVQPLGPGRWRVGGALSVHDWVQALGPTRIPPRVVTLGGLAAALLGRIPRPGDRTSLGNLLIEVEAMDKARVSSVILSLRNREEKTP